MKALNEYLLHFVTPRMADLLADPTDNTLGKVEKDVAILFVDIAGCARLCEKLPSREMNELIEFYFCQFFEVIQQRGGTVNEIMGDGFMAIFEDKGYLENINNAISAAVEICRLTVELKSERGRNQHDTQVHIGVHAGKALVGFTKFRAKHWERWTYTADGPVTNIAARLCQLAPAGSIFISEDVASVIKDFYTLEKLGPHRLKNVSESATFYQIKGSYHAMSDMLC